MLAPPGLVSVTPLAPGDTNRRVAVVVVVVLVVCLVRSVSSYQCAVSLSQGQHRDQTVGAWFPWVRPTCVAPKHPIPECHQWSNEGRVSGQNLACVLFGVPTMFFLQQPSSPADHHPVQQPSCGLPGCLVCVRGGGAVIGGVRRRVRAGAEEVGWEGCRAWCVRVCCVCCVWETSPSLPHWEGPSHNSKTFEREADRPLLEVKSCVAQEVGLGRVVAGSGLQRSPLPPLLLCVVLHTHTAHAVPIFLAWCVLCMPLCVLCGAVLCERARGGPPHHTPTPPCCSLHRRMTSC
jgi:hypothetical protein